MNLLNLFNDEILPFFSGAIYNHEEDKIYGAKEGTWIWWHEKGHQQQWKKDMPQRTQWSEQMLILVILFAVSFQKFDLAQFAFTLFFLLYLFYEIDASIYATRQKWFGVGKR
jgi:hypothetical protein